MIFKDSSPSMHQHEFMSHLLISHIKISSRSVFRPQYIESEAFCEVSQGLSAVNHFRKNLHLRCLAGF